MRLKPEQRRAVIITAAVAIAREHGLHRVTHGDVAKRCKIDTSVKTVRHYFADQAALWRAVVVEVSEMIEDAKGLGL
jgi:AcrR family transcriptional regulator